MKTTAFIFSAEPLGDAKIYDNCLEALDELRQSLIKKIGRVIKKQLRLYRVPGHEKSTMLYSQYALIAFKGELSDCLIEIVCNDNVQFVKWPKSCDIELGKWLTIEVVDWIDAYLLIENLMKDDV